MRGLRGRKGLALLVVLLIAAFPWVAPGNYYVALGITVGIYAIVALGLSLLAGNTRQFSLGQAAFYGVGAYTTALLNTRLGWGFIPCLIASGVAAGLAGYLVGLTSARLRHAYLAMSTVAFNLIFYAIITEWVELTGGMGGTRGIKVAEIAGFPFDNDLKFYYLVWIIGGAVLLFSRNLVASRAGRAMKAIGQDEVSAAVAGVDVVSYKLNVFALSAVYAGFAGSLLAFYLRFAGPQSFGVYFSVFLLLMIVVGGTGTAWGGLLGAAVLTLMPEGLRALSRVSVLPREVQLALNDYSYHLVILGIITFLFIVFLPRGLMGLITEGLGAGGWGLGARGRGDRSPAPSPSGLDARD